MKRDIGKSADADQMLPSVAYDWVLHCLHLKKKQQGPVVQSVVSLTSSLRVISLTILAD